jgi:membrane protein
MNIVFKTVVQFINSLRQFLLKDIWRLDFSKLSWIKVFLLRQLRILFLVISRFVKDRLPVRASALVYATLLSIVPMLAVMFSLLKGFGYHSELEPFLKRILEPLGDKAVQMIVPTIVNFVANASVAALGAFGFVFFLLSSISIINNMERAFNDVWRVKRTRSIHRRIGDYLSVLILGPVLVFGILAITASFQNYTLVRRIGEIPFVEILANRSAPFIASWVVFCFLYVFIPNTKVRFLSAIYGALIAGTLWQAMNYVFANFIVTAYQSGAKAALYASFAVFPLFLLWLFYSWIVVLLGAELAYVHQNLNKVVWEEHRKPMSWRMEESLALKIMLIVSQKFCQGEKGPSKTDLADHLNVPEHTVDRILSTLVDLELVNDTGRKDIRYTPAKCLEGLSLSEIIENLRIYGASDLPQEHDDDVNRLVGEIQDQYDKAIKEAFADASIRDLLERLN